MRTWIALFVSCTLSTTFALAVVPGTITIQGRLNDAADNPMSNAVVTMSFVLYDAQVGGGSLWSGESQVITTDSAGLWNARVGALIPLNQELFADSSRWLEIAVDDGNVVTTLPRIRLVTSPFAFRVGSVDGAAGGTITSKLTIGPGHQNPGAHGFVAGESNSAWGEYGSISGGKSNVIFDGASTISGGIANTTQGDSATVAGGAHNTVNGVGSTIGGGTRNSTTGAHNVVAGGTLNNAFLPTPGNGFAVIGGGTGNIIAGTASVIAGGSTNRANGALSVIGGGSYDTTNGASATVGGGSNNVASGDYSTIGGGNNNDAVLTSSVVAGGESNRAAGTRSTVGGGYSNTASEFASTVSGGQSNTASGLSSTVAGGIENAASGSYSFAVGYRDSALGAYSTAMGRTATARHDNSFVWGDGDIFLSSDTANQFKVWARNGMRLAATAGAAKQIRMGDRYRDNGIVAWAKINADGTVASEFGIASAERLFIGQYRIFIDAPAASLSTLVPVATVELGALPPINAAQARLIYVDQVSATSFHVHITDGTFGVVDNDFTVIVTAR